MIAPDKHTNVKYSVIYISGIILKEIQQNGIIEYEDLKKVIVKKVGEKSKENFMGSLSFLYLLNKIEYKPELDSIILVAQ